MNELVSPVGLQFGAGGLVALFVLLIATDRLVTRRRLLDERQAGALRVADKEQQLVRALAERDTWQAAAAVEAAERRALQATTAEALELNRTAVHLLSAMPLPSANGVTASAVVQLPASPAS